eukprot:888487-Pleurochrysis_carterae.AAC.1
MGALVGKLATGIANKNVYHSHVAHLDTFAAADVDARGRPKRSATKSDTDRKGFQPFKAGDILCCTSTEKHTLGVEATVVG